MSDGRLPTVAQTAVGFGISPAGIKLRVGATKLVGSRSASCTVVCHRQVLDWTRLDWTGLDWTRLDSTRLDSTRLDSTRLELAAELWGEAVPTWMVSTSAVSVGSRT